MIEKHSSVNNVLWRVVAGRIRRDHRPDAARGPLVGHPCSRQLPKRTFHTLTILEKVTVNDALSLKGIDVMTSSTY